MKLLTTIALTIALFISSAVPVAHALTAADIDVLISLGVIPAERAAAARAMFSSGAVTSGTVSPSSASVATPLVAGTSCIDIPRNLILGTQDTAVTLLQQFLRTQGHFTAAENTSYFGTQTKDAVVAFQLAQGLITSASQVGAGSVGPATIAKIKSLTCAGVTPEQAPQGLAKLQSTQSYAKPERGETRYRYTMSITPADDIALWRVRLICDGDQIITNRRDLTDCGESTEFTVGSSGKKTFTVAYTNKSRGSQSVGVIAEAIGKDGRVIDVAEAIDYLDVPGVRNLAPNPGKGGYRVTFISSTSTTDGLGGGGGTDTNPYPRCDGGDPALVTQWSEGPTPTFWWNDAKSLANLYSLPADERANLAGRIELVEPNNRTIAEIVEDYKDTHLFPTFEYVRSVNALGDKYNAITKNWYPIDETEASLEKKRREITNLVPGMPSYMISKAQIAKNEYIVALGDVFKLASGNRSYHAPTFKWSWQGREFGVFYDKFRIYNGTVSTSTVNPCQKLRNDEFDILLFKK